MRANHNYREKILTGQGFLEILRKATAPIHEQLEALQQSRSLMSKHATLEDYLFYLSCMQPAIAFFDQIILPRLTAILPDSLERRKLPQLVADIRILESKGISRKHITPMPVPSVTNDGIAMGMAYVIEGSTLGGRVLLKHVERNFLLGEANGATFFGGYQERTAQ